MELTSLVLRYKFAQHSMHPTGGSRRVFKQFTWLGVDSVKVALSRPAHQRVTRTVGQTYCKERLFKNEVCSHYHKRYKTNFVRLMCLPIRSILPLRLYFFGERGCTHSPEVQPTTINRQIGEND